MTTRITSEELGQLAGLIADLAKVSASEVTLVENPDGTFTLTICKFTFVGSLAQVLAWARRQCEIADDLDDDDLVDANKKTSRNKP